MQIAATVEILSIETLFVSPFLREMNGVLDDPDLDGLDVL